MPHEDDHHHLCCIEAKLDHILCHVHAQGLVLSSIAELLQVGGMLPADVTAVNERLKAHAATLSGIAVESSSSPGATPPAT